MSFSCKTMKVIIDHTALHGIGCALAGKARTTIEYRELLQFANTLLFADELLLPAFEYEPIKEHSKRIVATLRRIESGQMTEAQALSLARKWLWDNPVELYRLSV